MALGKDAHAADYYFINEGNSFACEVYHILYDPVMVLISFKNNYKLVPKFGGSYNLRVDKIVGKKAISFDLKFNQEISLKEGHAFLFEVADVTLPLGWVEKWYLKRIFNYSQRQRANFIADFNFDHYNKIVALFAQPKKVFLVTTVKEEKSHNFPIDLCAKIGQTFLMGVRNTNAKANALQIEDEFYISTAASDDYKRIYSFGKFNKSEEQKQDYHTQKSDMPVPNLVCDYSLVKLTKKIMLQHQTIYVANIIENKVLNNNKKELYHLHKVWFLKYNHLKEIRLVQS